MAHRDLIPVRPPPLTDADPRGHETSGNLPPGDDQSGPGFGKTVTLTPGPRAAASKPRCLHLFSGPSARQDGLSAYLRLVGWEVDDFDIVNDPDRGSQDLSSDHLWVEFQKSLREGQYDFVFMGTPCETFSRARTGPPGPRPLRDARYPYGLPKARLTVDEQKQVRLGTYFAVQTATLARLAYEHGVGFAIENPQPAGQVSLFLLREFCDLAALPGVVHVDFDQCEFQAEAVKPTRVLYYAADLKHLGRRCSHPPRWHLVDRDTTPWWHWGAHPPLRGHDPQGRWRTRAAAAYPAALNRAIVKGIVARGRRTLPSLTGPAVPTPA